MFPCKDAHPLASAIKICNGPKVAVCFKVIVVNPTEIKKVFYERPIHAMQAVEIERLNLLCYTQEPLPHSGHSILTGHVSISEHSYAATAKFFNIIRERFDGGTERSHHANLRKPIFGIGEMESRQRVFATLRHQ